MVPHDFVSHSEVFNWILKSVQTLHNGNFTIYRLASHDFKLIHNSQYKIIIILQLCQVLQWLYSQLSSTENAVTKITIATQHKWNDQFCINPNGKYATDYKLVPSQVPCTNIHGYTITLVFTSIKWPLFPWYMVPDHPSRHHNNPRHDRKWCLIGAGGWLGKLHKAWWESQLFRILFLFKIVYKPFDL